MKQPFLQKIFKFHEFCCKFMRMKQILLLTILVLIFCLQSFGQDKPECPIMNIQGPAGQTPIGGNMDFSVLLVSKFDNSKFEYRWTVSNGVAFNGQGTSAISIPTNETLQGQIITATVEIKGLPTECKNSYSASGDVASPPPYCPGVNKDTINGNSSWEEITIRLQNLSTVLRNELGSKATVTFSVTNSSELNKVIALQKKLLKMSKKYQILFDKILMKIKKDFIYEITFEFLPAGITTSN